MGFKVRFKSNNPIGNQTGLCCWAYQVMRDDGKWKKGQTIALGLDPKTDVKSPLKYADCANYSLNPKKGRDGDGKDRIVDLSPLMKGKGLIRKLVATNVPADTDDLLISFIAPCKASNGAIVEFFEVIPDSNDTSQEQNRGGFIMREVDGGTTTTGPALASLAVPKMEDSVALLARFEALKFRQLLGNAGAGLQAVPAVISADVPSGGNDDLAITDSGLAFPDRAVSVNGGGDAG